MVGTDLNLTYLSSAKKVFSYGNGGTTKHILQAHVQNQRNEVWKKENRILHGPPGMDGALDMDEEELENQCFLVIVIVRWWLRFIAGILAEGPDLTSSQLP